MTTQLLTEQIRSKASFLCVGLDSDLAKLPPTVLNQPESQFEFNKAIIDDKKIINGIANQPNQKPTTA